MRIKIIFTASTQSEKLLEELVAAGHKSGEDFIVDKANDRFLEVMIQPSLFREINDLIKKDKEFFAGVSVEIEDQQVSGGGQGKGGEDEEDHLQHSSKQEDRKQEEEKKQVKPGKQ